MVVEKRLLKMSLPLVFLALMTETIDPSGEAIVDVEHEMDFDGLKSDVVLGIVLRSGEVLCTGSGLENSPCADHIETGKKKAADIGTPTRERIKLDVFVPSVPVVVARVVMVSMDVSLAAVVMARMMVIITMGMTGMIMAVTGLIVVVIAALDFVEILLSDDVLEHFAVPVLTRQKGRREEMHRGACKNERYGCVFHV